MTINATLKCLVLASPRPDELADFYRHAFDYSVTVADGERRCEGAERSLWIRPGRPNQLLESHFQFTGGDELERYASEIARRGVVFERRVGVQDFGLVVEDPEHRKVLFRAGGFAPMAPRAGLDAPRPARLQHYAVRTPAPRALLEFYVERLGFTCSDLVHDDAGDLTAAFLRTDPEHHALAIFRAPEVRFDHFSCETASWLALRDWADTLAGRSVRLAWGIGRHGPGNDTFFMVQDPDGNLAEISAELEICAEGRPVGRWHHRMETLNQWGVAIMRS
jgi:catechol 2,3-dioxygenase